MLGALDFKVGRGETVALTGPSGIGKTSLLRAVGGLGGAVDGRIDAPERTAFVFQEPTLLPWRDARTNIRLTAKVSAATADATLAAVGLEGRGDDFPGTLSLGQQRRLSLARAFASEPALVLLDEPFVSLDPALADEMMDLFHAWQARSGAAALLVTHAPAEAARMADRILRLAGSPARLVSAPRPVRQNTGS